MKKDIAIIGTGISGLTCAHLLHQQHQITVFEANDYIGGHTATKDIHISGRDYAIDTGFIVFNDWTYPNFIKLMDKLGVPSQPTEMSFSVKNPGENLEYNGHTLNTLFAQRRNLVRPKFWSIVSDIVKFNKLCKQALADQTSVQSSTLDEFIQQNGLSDDFARNYILPMCAAIWSSSLNDVKQFPLAFFLKFFNNHGLLNITDRPQWHTLIGGSKSYIAPLTEGFTDRVLLNSPVAKVRRVNDKWAVTTKGGSEQAFDEVIMACHSDQALAMLDNPDNKQKQVLSAIPYADNEVVLHTDTSLLPDRQLAWASWNYEISAEPEKQARPATVTYNMNILQRIESEHTFCVTLNNTAAIAPDKILGTYHYAHPQFSQQMVAAQQQREDICGKDGLHFCGAYWYNGFHEDGVRSALDVCSRFGASL